MIRTISWLNVGMGIKNIQAMRNGIAWVMCICFFAILPLEYASLQWIETEQGTWQIFRDDLLPTLGLAWISFIRLLVILVGSFIFLLLGFYDRFEFERHQFLAEISPIHLAYYTAWIQAGVMIGSIPFLWINGEGEWYQAIFPYLPHFWMLILGVILFQRSLRQIGFQSLSWLKWVQILLVSIVIYGWATFFMDAWITKPVADFFQLELVSWREDTINQGIDQANSQGALSLFFQWLMIGFIGVFAEEFLFRGVIYETIKNYSGKWIGILLSATLFALFHVDIVLLAPLLALGIILGGLKVYFNSLWAPIIFHMLNNSLSVWIQMFEGW